MSTKNVIYNAARNARWRQEIDEGNRTIKIVYNPDMGSRDQVFTEVSPITYAIHLQFIRDQVESGNWIFIKKCKAKRLVGR